MDELLNEKKGFINKSEIEFSDISSEKKRVYYFSNGKRLEIKNPLYLNVSSSGGHRIYNADGYSFYIKPSEGWYIKWKSRTGMPNFVK